MKALLKYDPLFLLILLLGATGILLLYIYQGIGLTNDSGFYVYSGCYNFMVDPTGAPLTIFPPLYPTLIGAIHFITGLAPLKSAAILNFICYLIFAWGIRISGRDHFKTSFYKYFFYAISLLGIPILFNAYMLWSEMLFITLLWFSLLYFYNFTVRGNNKDLYLFSLLFLLCFFTRYAALGFLPALYLILLSRFNRNQIIAYSITVLFTVILPALWLIRNHFLNSNPPYESAKLSFTENVFMNTEVFSHFIVADHIPDLTGSLSMICLLVILGFSAWKEKEDYIRKVHILLIVSYTLFLIILNSIKDIQIPDERYYSILYPSLFLVFFLSIEKRQTQVSPLFKKFIGAIIILWSIYPLARSYKNTADFIHNGIGYQDAKWRNNHLIQKIQTLDGQIVSNNPILIILMGERAATSDILPNSTEDLYCVLWTNEALTYLPDHTLEWSNKYRFKEIYGSSEGNIYKLTKLN